MTPTLSTRVYVALDRLTKITGLVFLVAALGGVPSSTFGSVLLGAAGISIGLLTVFVEPSDEAPERNRTERRASSAPAPASGGFFDRFVHPRAALVAIVGIVLLVGDFFIAAVGLILRGHDAALAVTLFQLSGVVGAIAIVLVAISASYVSVLYARQFVSARLGAP